MSKREKPLNAKVRDDNRYYIVQGTETKPTKTKVQADDIAYGVIGLRQNFGKHTVLDHIPSGRLIGGFPSMTVAREAVVELMQVWHFRDVRVPNAIKPAVKEILRRLK